MQVERLNQILNDPIYETVKSMKYCFSHHCDHINEITGELLMSYETACGLLEFLKYDSDFNDAMKVIHADNRRYNRIFHRLNYMMTLGSCLFVTLTFSDDAMNRNNEVSRKKAVKTFLKAHSDLYIANIDFGSKTGREHYHAVILNSDPKICDDWVYGYSNAQMIRDNIDSSDRIARYMIKIINHFVKSTVRRNYVIYSRSKWTYKVKKKPAQIIRLPDEQLCFWEHLPHLNDSNFDYEYE